jgi:hypothetical protein
MFDQITAQWNVPSLRCHVKSSATARILNECSESAIKIRNMCGEEKKKNNSERNNVSFHFNISNHSWSVNRSILELHELLDRIHLAKDCVNVQRTAILN